MSKLSNFGKNLIHAAFNGILFIVFAIVAIAVLAFGIVWPLGWVAIHVFHTHTHQTHTIFDPNMDVGAAVVVLIVVSVFLINIIVGIVKFFKKLWDES